MHRDGGHGLTVGQVGHARSPPPAKLQCTHSGCTGPMDVSTPRGKCSWGIIPCVGRVGCVSESGIAGQENVLRTEVYHRLESGRVGVLGDLAYLVVWRV